MKMCLAPCYQGCTDERYAEEAAAVEQFLATRGESRLVTLRTRRDEASANLEFEAAAALHAQVVRVESVRALAPELVRPLAQLRAVILQASAVPGEVAVFLYENGRLSGPAGFSTLGMRIQNEQSGSTSLFAQPVAIEPIPEASGNRDQGSGISTAETEPTPAAETMKCTGFSPYVNASQDEGAFQIAERLNKESALYQGTTSVVPQTPILLKGTGFSPYIQASQKEGALAPEGISSEAASGQPAKLARGLLEARMEAVLAALAEPTAISPTLRQGHLALLKRWYYRPEIRRTGEIFFADAEGRWPVKAMLRGVGRVAAKMLTVGNRTE
jgi:hypothetical protein